MTFANEPQYDQSIKQHCHRRGALDGIACPTLRFFKAQILLAVMEGDFDRPALGVPSEDLFRRGTYTGRVEGFPSATALQRLDRDHAQGPLGYGIDAGFGIADPSLLLPAVNRQCQSPRTLPQHGLRRGQKRTASAWPPVGARFSFGRGGVESGVHGQATGQVAVGQGGISIRFVLHRPNRPQREIAAISRVRRAIRSIPRPIPDDCGNDAVPSPPASCSDTTGRGPADRRCGLATAGS